MADWAEQEANITELPDYPEDWSAEQRVQAYWYALYQCGMPATTASWHTVWNLAQRNNRKEHQ